MILWNLKNNSTEVISFQGELALKDFNRKDYGVVNTPPKTAKYIIRRLGSIKKNQKILDPCTGSGVFVKKLLEFGIGNDQIFSYDINPGYKPDLLHNCDKGLPFPDNSFNFAYSMGVIHHTPNPQRAIDEIYRVLKKGGKGHIMLYHKYSLNRFVHLLLKKPYENVRNINELKKDAHFIYTFSKSQLKEMFRKFEHLNIKIEYLYGAGWGNIYNFIPKLIYFYLSKLFGWHLSVFFQK